MSEVKVYETTRLYTRDGIKTIDYEVHMKLQKHCEELEALVKHHHEKFKEACQHIRDQAQEHREKLQGYMDMCYDHNARIFDLELELKEAVADYQAELFSCNEALENVKKRRDEYYVEKCEAEKKLAVMEQAYRLDIGVYQKTIELCRNALKTIKHTECDTYRVAADALKATSNEPQGCKWHDDRPVGSCDCLANSGTGEEL